MVDDVSKPLDRIRGHTFWSALAALLPLALIAWAFNRALVGVQAELARSRQRLDLAMQGADEGFWELDPADGTLYCSPRVLELLGLDQDSGLDSLAAWEARIAPEDLPRARQALADHLSGKQAQYHIECRVRHRDGHHLWLLIRGQAVRDAEGRPGRVHGLLHDISERKRLEERIRHMAQHDPLTGLANRALFSDLLRQAQANARRDEERFAVLLVDLDNFKPVNDQHGHPVGDLMLIEVARRASRCVRGSDIVARIGGDEFVVLLRSVRDATHAVAIAEKVRAALRQPFELDGLHLSISASLGVALYPDDGEDETTLMRHADQAMYRAKQAGRDGIRVYQAGDQAGA